MTGFSAAPERFVFSSIPTIRSFPPSFFCHQETNHSVLLPLLPFRTAIFFHSAFNLAPRSKSKLYSIAQIDAQQYSFVHSLFARFIFSNFLCFSLQFEAKRIENHKQKKSKPKTNFLISLTHIQVGSE